MLLPSAIVFLLLLCNDAEVLGPWVNTFRQKVLASIIVGVLVLFSLIPTVWRATSRWGGCPLPTLGPPRWSRGQKVAMHGRRGYLVLAVLVPGLKLGQLATGH